MVLGELVDVRTRADLARLFAERGYRRGCEVGVADGRYSLLLCETIPGLTLFCVDPWARTPGNRRGGGNDQHARNLELARQRLAPYDARFDRRVSLEAVQDHNDGSLDFVFIDANHDFDFVMRDLIEWTPKVREGGIVSGHDYYHFDRSGVVEAVDAYTAAHGITFALTTEKGPADSHRLEPSYWWTR